MAPCQRSSVPGRLAPLMAMESGRVAGPGPVPAAWPAESPRARAALRAPTRAGPAGDDWADRPGAESFERLRSELAGTGGLARGDDLAQLMTDRWQGDVAVLARLIVGGEVFGFDWQCACWLPMFQFDLRDLSIRPEAQQVRADLDPALDGWQQATWFARPNGWLVGRRPVDLLSTSLPAVLAAARADRFVTAG